MGKILLGVFVFDRIVTFDFHLFLEFSDYRLVISGFPEIRHVEKPPLFSICRSQKTASGLK
jgi:hypothetical protein